MGTLSVTEYGEDGVTPVFTLALDVNDQHAFIMQDLVTKLRNGRSKKGDAIDPKGVKVGTYVFTKHRKRK